MSVDNIVAKISADADAECAKISEDAQKKAREFEEKTMRTANETIRAIDDQAQADVEEIQRRQMLIFELESRKDALAVRRNMLDEAFAVARRKLDTLPEDKWEALISRCVLDGCETGDERLCVPADDRAMYQNGLLAKLNKRLEEAGKTGALTIMDKPADFSGGVLVVGESGDYDASFAALLKNVRSEYEKAAADILFPAEV